MWDTLKKRHAIANAPKIHQFKMNIANCKQGGPSVIEFYSKMTNLWAKLVNHDKVPYCACCGCKCRATNKIVEKHEEEKAHQFFMGQNDDSY